VIRKNRYIIHPNKTKWHFYEKITRREFSYQSFQLSFNVPENAVNVDKINAKYSDGILQITLPKSEEMKPKPSKEIKIS